ncbi:hypothetical protein GGI01_001422 [Coemansia sp. RSA 376]|nr:hypothetical protein H4S03_001880 [Coemansia sp. S3946]KAJ2262586.1 hypothetical protein GGI01_001422 [Coemansia sp. RSA 376]
MTRDMQHEYTELADMARAPGRPAVTAESTYDPVTASATMQRRHRVAGLLDDPELRKHALVVVTYVLLWYTFSGVLSVYNKWLFGASERDFPFPLFVGSIHMVVQYTLATACIWMFPNLRPSQSPTWRVYLTRVVPCGIASALDIGLSNISLRTITLTFYTMCKSSNLGFVLVFAFIFGLERPRVALIAIIVVISVGVALMAAGEVDFVLSGFLEAITSSAMSGLRWSLTQILLLQTRFGMNNPIATMSKLTPVIGMCMLTFSLILEDPFTEISKNKNLDTTHGAVFIVFMMMLGGLLAFAMVLSEFFLISRTSVVTLSIAGMLKEVMMFGVAHLVFGDTMTLVNLCGLLVALFGIGMYNWLKIHDTLHSGKMAEAGITDDYSSERLEEACQRQVAFVGDSYDGVADLELSTSSDWAIGRYEDSVENSDGTEDDTGGGNKARRRHSVFNFGTKDANATSSTSSANVSEPSADFLADTQPSTRSKPPPISLDLNGIITQDSIKTPNSPKLKY